MRNKCLQRASVLRQMSRTIKATAGMKSAGSQPNKAWGGGLVRHTYIPVVCRQLNSVRSKTVDEISLRLSRVKHRCLLNTDRRLGLATSGMRICLAHMHHACISVHVHICTAVNAQL